MGALSYTYDGLSRVRTETDGKGQTTRYEYDPLDRVTRVLFHDGEDVTYSYDGDGNRIQRNDSTGISRWEYDPLNRLTEQRLQNGSAVTTYTYDAASNLATLTDDGGTVTYAYNQVNRLTSLTEPGGHQTTFSYDPNDDRTQTNYPNGVSLLVTYDDSERLTSIIGKKLASGQVLTSFAYSYSDAFGGDTDLRASVTDGVTGVTTSYGYDALNRLTSASGGGQSYSYAYDANGNRTSQTINGVTTSYSYNAANQLTAAGGTTYTHDGNGNLTGSSAGLAYAYNAKDQTISIQAGADAETRDLEYAGTNQWEWISERGFGSGFQDFEQNALGLSIRSDTGDTAYYTRDDDGTLVGQRVLFGSRYYYLFDGAGSVVALTDASGNVAATYHYEPFGKLVSETGSVPNPWRFHGQYYSSATQKYKIGLRWYDPELGRWTQRDPIDDPLKEAGWNPYDYAGQDPINNVDPAGEFVWKKIKRGIKQLKRAVKRVDRVLNKANEKAAEAEAEVRNAARFAAKTYKAVPLPPAVKRCIIGAGVGAALSAGTFVGIKAGTFAGCAVGVVAR